MSGKFWLAARHLEVYLFSETYMFHSALVVSWPSCCVLNTRSRLWPQGLCTCFLVRLAGSLECPCLRCLHGAALSLSVFCSYGASTMRPSHSDMKWQPFSSPELHTPPALGPPTPQHWTPSNTYIDYFYIVCSHLDYKLYKGKGCVCLILFSTLMAKMVFGT